MDKATLLSQLNTKMEGAINVFENNLKGLRVGRASANFLDPVQAEAYGSRQPISQLATISTPDARTISIQVWDKSVVKQIEKAIAESNLGLTPMTDGQNIRINIPSLSEERRKDLVKVAAKYSEESKVSVRNIRRDIMDGFKKLEKDKTISEDELRSLGDKVQKITDEFIAKIEKTFSVKEKEILSI
jgi:ribosome recycling factor